MSELNLFSANKSEKLRPKSRNPCLVFTPYSPFPIPSLSLFLFCLYLIVNREKSHDTNVHLSHLYICNNFI